MMIMTVMRNLLLCNELRKARVCELVYKLKSHDQGFLPVRSAFMFSPSIVTSRSLRFIMPTGTDR